MLIRINRTKRSPNSILGEFTVYLNDKKAFECWCLENAFRAIPEGQWDIVNTYSPRFDREMFEINVPDRTGIRIHAGNTYADSSGCILLGESYIDRKTDYFIFNSQLSVDKFEKITEGVKVGKIEISQEIEK
ncbi:MAG: DUF5675 family protein [Rickettsiales bacterium]|jgi:hypothetical protein|nr:DUF5675 family protein [Rickettsiales bacterium]